MSKTMKKLLPLSCTFALVALSMPATFAQQIDNTNAYALANQLADEVELVRERMGKPFDDSPRLPVTGVTQTELYFQVQTLLRKKLCFFFG